VDVGAAAQIRAEILALRDAGCELVLANTPQPCTMQWQLEQVQDIAALVFAFMRSKKGSLADQLEHMND
jgi:hypothetical protein